LAAITTTYFYIIRSQEIRIDFIPEQFEFCDKNISKGNSDYDEIVRILTHHTGGWTASYTSYAPIRVYYAPAFQVNVIGKQVIVSYKTDAGYPQFIKLIKHNWPKNCTKSSEITIRNAMGR